MSDDATIGESVRYSAAYRAGVWTQGVVLGLFLFFALCQLYVLAGDIRLFRYQAF